MTQSGLGRISVIIANYNYGRFVGAAIESALAIDWPDVEVVVVDDGSTDESREVIERFADRVVVMHQKNQSQRVARNRGFEASTGEAVIHLDSDDVLYPQVGRELARVWNDGVSKVQFPMARIDEDGESLGSVFPRFPARMTPQLVRRWARETTSYPTPPGSGNAYSRHMLEQIFPLDDSCGAATDSACLAVAPFLGDVVTIHRPLAGYRIHAGNTSDLFAHRDRFAQVVARAVQRQEFARRVVGPSLGDPARALRRSRPLLELRIASRRMRPDASPFPDDNLRRLLVDLSLSPFRPGPESILGRCRIAAWGLLTLLVPTGPAHRLISLRYGKLRLVIGRARR